MVFFSLFSTALSSVFYGIIITAAIMALLYAVIKALSKTITSLSIFYITGVVMGILLVIQLSLMIGAFQAKEAADSAEIYLHQLLENRYGTVGAQDSQRIFDAVTHEYPIIGTFLGVADFSGHNISDLAASMHSTIIEYLDSYIWHRIGWTLGIIFVGVIVVMLFDKPNANLRTSRSALSSRHEGRRARTGSHQRVHRRR